LAISTSWLSWKSAAVTGPVPSLAQGDHGFILIVQDDRHTLQVQQDVDDVLLHALDGAVLVQHAVDLHFVMAQPGMDDSRMRRSVLPRVWPKPRSSGSSVTRARVGLTSWTSM
jgi:hypothetical protein